MCPAADPFHVPPGPQEDYYNTLDPGGDMHMLYAGQYRCNPGLASFTTRSYYVLHYVLEGEGDLDMDGAHYDLGPGAAFFLFPGVPHHYRASRRNPWSYRWICFGGPRAKACVEGAGIRRDRPAFAEKPDPALARLFADAVDNLREKPPGYELRADGLLRLILAKVAAWAWSPSRASRDVIRSGEEYVERAMRFVQLNYKRAITVTDMARYLGFERTYFSTLFRRHAGASPKDYLLRVRLEKAKQALAGGELSLAHVASAVGYPDYRVFAKIFRKREGLAPGEFRERAQRTGGRAR